jgi:hypothetical protein
MIDKDEFLLWRDSSVTKQFLKGLNDRLDKKTTHLPKLWTDNAGFINHSGKILELKKVVLYLTDYDTFKTLFEQEGE